MAEGCGGGHDDRGGPARDPGRVAARCAAIVPAWRAEATLLDTLASLVAEGASLERIIVVGCVSDRCLDIARRFRGVEVVALPGRATAGRARNVGRAKAADCELLLFVDADCTLERGSVARLVDELDSRCLDAAGAAIAQRGDGIIGWVRHLLEFKESLPGVPGHPSAFLPSTVLLVRAGVFDACGGFPDIWPGEDLVLAHRMSVRGARMAKIDEVVARHAHPDGLFAFLRHEHRLGATAARARLLEQMRGSAFAGRPWLAPVLMAGRAGRAVVWVLRHRRGDLLRFATALPLYVTGLTAWTLGFARVRRTGVRA